MLQAVAVHRGLGFRILDDRRPELRNLLAARRSGSRPRSPRRFSRRSLRFRDLLVMEYLAGAEYSIDCLAERGRLLRAVARRKPTRGGGTQRLEENAELLTLAGRADPGLRAGLAVQHPGALCPCGAEGARNQRAHVGRRLFCLPLRTESPRVGARPGAGDAREEELPQPRLGIAVHQQYHEFVFA